MSTVSQPRQDRERSPFTVVCQPGESLELAVLRVALQHHPDATAIRQVLEPALRGPKFPVSPWTSAGSLHPDLHPNLTLDERMSRLAETFPTLVGAVGVRPWDANIVLDQLSSPWPGAGARHALAFVLSVWNRRLLVDELADLFDAVEALTAWDPTHRAAFVAWAARPWWA